MKKLIASVALASLSALAWALPTLQQVETEVGQGHYAQAESMMREVVAAKPDSARAHYVYAEILAHDGKLAIATDEARKARDIDPDVKFTDPEKFRAFEASLLRAQAPAARSRLTPSQGAAPIAPARVAPAAATGLPSWVWLVGLLAIGLVLWRMFSRSRAAGSGAIAAPGSGVGMPMQPGANVPGYGPGAVGSPYGPGYAPQRPGMMGVGLAAAGGVAAGMLADELLHRRQGGTVDNGGVGNTGGGFFDAPGGSAANDLENRPIDFGTGGNDWDAGSSDGGGFDAGSDGGSDTGGGWD
jgi:tetratricopeptide repeat protein